MTPAELRALFDDHQASRFLQLSFPRGDGPEGVLLLAQQLDAFEAVGRDFDYVVSVISDDAALEFKPLLGKLLTVSLHREDGSRRHFNGHIFSLALERLDGGLAYYQVVLRPWLALLALRQDNHLFHGRTLYEQTAEIFADYPQRDWDWRVGGEDPAMTDACQFQESDHNYLHRRWEARGIHYWYEHRADGHTLVLSDDSLAHSQAIDGEPTMQWQAEAGAREDDGIHRFNPLRSIAPTQYSAASYDFKRARAQHADTPGVGRPGEVPALEVYDWGGAYGFKDSGDGARLTRLRMQALEAAAQRFEARSNERSAQPHRHFRLVGHYALGGAGDAHDAEAEFLIVQVQHHARNNYASLGRGGPGSHYENHFVCLRRQVPWRVLPGFNSQAPRMHGAQTAIVVGPAGQEIHTDEYGRVRVQFHWDRVGRHDERSSAWVRVASTWAGSNFGFMAVPRIGQEVIVQWLDGDPDRPIVTGRVYNQDNMPPWPLPAAQTQTGLLSRSSPGGGYDNANALRFEDARGQEELWLHAERDQRIEVEHDERHWVGRDRAKTIDRDETTHVRQDRTEVVDRHERITVHGTRTEQVDGDETITIHSHRRERVDHDETVSIGHNRSEDVGRDEKVVIGAHQTLRVGASRTRQVGAGETVSIAQAQKVDIGDNHSLSVGGNQRITVQQAKTETVALAKALTIGLGYQVSVGGAMNTTVGLMQAEQVGQDKSVTVGATFSTQVGSKYTITVVDEFSIVVGEARFTMRSDGTITLSGKDVIVQAAGNISAKADAKIAMKATQIDAN